MIRTSILCACLLATASARGALSPEEIVRKSLANYERDYKDALHYTYIERDEEVDGTRTKVSVSEVIPVNGSPYERLIRRDGQPLTPEQQQKEDAKLQKRRAESAAEQAKRIHEYQTSREFLNEVPDAFIFRLTGEETIEGRPNYVIACVPKPGYAPRSKNAAMFSHLEATLWIDEQDLQWTKANAKVTATISMGWILARIGPGAHMTFFQTRLNATDWLPARIDVDGDARVLLVKDHPIHEHMTFSDFKRAEAPVGQQSVDQTR